MKRPAGRYLNLNVRHIGKSIDRQVACRVQSKEEEAHGHNNNDEALL
jgi:hypothetical protein